MFYKKNKSGLFLEANSIFNGLFLTILNIHRFVLFSTDIPCFIHLVKKKSIKSMKGEELIFLQVLRGKVPPTPKHGTFYPLMSMGGGFFPTV